MNWNTQDNKHYRGTIDRIYVSDTESYEVDYFIDEYLKTRNYTVNDQNRRTIGQWLETYQGRAPHRRNVLNQFLDTNVRRT